MSKKAQLLRASLQHGIRARSHWQKELSTTITTTTKTAQSNTLLCHSKTNINGVHAINQASTDKPVPKFGHQLLDKHQNSVVLFQVLPLTGWHSITIYSWCHRRKSKTFGDFLQVLTFSYTLRSRASDH